MELVRVFSDSSRSYRMPCQLKRCFLNAENEQLIMVAVQSPALTYHNISLKAGEREMFFKYDPKDECFVEASNGKAGGIIQYRDNQGSFSNLTTAVCQELDWEFLPWLKLV